MTNPARSVLLVTVTEPGLQEQQDAELAQKLADMKAAMTDEELDALIARDGGFRRVDGGEREQHDDRPDEGRQRAGSA